MVGKHYICRKIMGMKILLIIIGILLFLFGILDMMNEEEKLANITRPLYEFLGGLILIMLGFLI